MRGIGALLPSRVDGNFRPSPGFFLARNCFGFRFAVVAPVAANFRAGNVPPPANKAADWLAS